MRGNPYPGHLAAIIDAGAASRHSAPDRAMRHACPARSTAVVIRRTGLAGPSSRAGEQLSRASLGQPLAAGDRRAGLRGDRGRHLAAARPAAGHHGGGDASADVAARHGAGRADRPRRGDDRFHPAQRHRAHAGHREYGDHGDAAATHHGRAPASRDRHRGTGRACAGELARRGGSAAAAGRHGAAGPRGGRPQGRAAVQRAAPPGRRHLDGAADPADRGARSDVRRYRRGLAESRLFRGFLQNRRARR